MKSMPITVRRAIELLGLFFLVWAMAIGRDILAPLLLAFFLSLVLLPLYYFLRKHRFPEVLAIGLNILVMLLVFGVIIWFLVSQTSNLAADLPTIRQNITHHLSTLSAWINAKTNFSPDEQLKFIKEQSDSLLNNGVNMLTGAAGSAVSVIVFFALLPLYTFLLLFYQNLLLRFIFLWFPPESHERVKEALSEIKSIIKSYLTGLLIQVTYMTVLVGGALLLIGIKHALLIGVIFAFLNLIPYVGALIGNIIGVLLTLASSPDLWPIFTVLITIAVAQFLDNNILMPRIVGSKVKINALAVIIGLLIGGKVAGIMGMFLALPVIAVLKIIFDRTNNFQQWGVLLGDERPSHSPMRHPQLRKQDEQVKSQLAAENNIDPPKK
ncbi:AI-2E family transporter [Adhaeribacter rhizoryzae]|uniref:AI-2E family transporter n=1 Tax=Adhaeribacter rhizoryzae TaxID=2607907 RepID=A0A5M6D1A7_9BACT|nr:AI-2E family transporter [Adhaeribacter rhizoryzae]KAA5541291.1 AI-2E family transporter [Adhaeribacter rhizoryzae]